MACENTLTFATSSWVVFLFQLSRPVYHRAAFFAPQSALPIEHHREWITPSVQQRSRGDIFG